MRYEQSTSDFITTSQPGRLGLGLENQVFVPVLQSLSVGLSVALAAGVLTLLGGATWVTAGRWAAGVGVLSWAGTTVWFVVGGRQALWAREELIGRDLDGDGTIGEPEPKTVRVELHDAARQQTKYVDLPLPESKLRVLAVAVVLNGKPFSRRGLRGVLSQSEYARTSSELVRRGLARDIDGKRELTLAG